MNMLLFAPKLKPDTLDWLSVRLSLKGNPLPLAFGSILLMDAEKANNSFKAWLKNRPHMPCPCPACVALTNDAQWFLEEYKCLISQQKRNGVSSS